MGWVSLLLEVPAADADALSDALMNHGALSISVEDASAGTAEEKPLFGEPGSAPEALWDRSMLVALCEADADLDTLVAQAAKECGIAPPSFRSEAVADQDWVRVTQSQFDPIRISERLWIVPSWHEVPDPRAVALQLDPGLAFGTGSHPTTRMCLRWLEENASAGVAVLDYGTGSGILAIAAAKFGAQPVLGVDIDAEAVEQARMNASRNRVDAKFMDTEAQLSFTADLVVANILAMPLKILAPLLAAHCRPGGRIVLAGLLDTQDEDVSRSYAPWFDMKVYAREEGWTALEGARK